MSSSMKEHKPAVVVAHQTDSVLTEQVQQETPQETLPESAKPVRKP